ncbi:hypothetical protein KVH15_21835 [Streptomyces olivaceus]|uniref:hypothetical protein n=1 Tax=Streptomyces olivaceus TaxID=47716 RepID=UPI001CCDBC7C|nr:hypothetical protein [Streptomyces olivaceus]MBZ6083648.1 hypothetical protein [Streptomyces olivaceus]
MNKVIGDVDGPTAELPDSTSPAVAGSGPGGVPNTLIQVLHERGVPGPSVVSDDCGAM